MTNTEADSAINTLSSFDRMNQYPEHDYEWRSTDVYSPPRRTLGSGWMKFHATRDCGSHKLRFKESTRSAASDSKSRYYIYCSKCRTVVPEEDILFIGGEWWAEEGMLEYRQSLDNLNIPNDRVVELGPNPTESEVRDALNLTRIEIESRSILGSYNKDTWDSCDECGHDVPIQFNKKCRMCYDGEWTDDLQQSVNTLDRYLREHVNNSYIHRLDNYLSPTEPAGTASKGDILWRRHDQEQTSKLVEVTQRLKDYDDGHMEYVLSDPTHTETWTYHEDDLNDCFWDTELYSDEARPVMDDRISELWERVKEQ